MKYKRKNKINGSEVSFVGVFANAVVVEVFEALDSFYSVGFEGFLG